MNRYFRKISVTYIIALLIMSLLIGLAFNYMISQALISENESELIQTAQSFEDRYVMARESVFFNINIGEELEILNEYSDASFWLVDSRGNIYIDNEKSRQLVSSSISIDDINEVFRGETLLKQGVISEISEDKMLILGYPLTYKGNVEYALFLHQSMPEVLNLRNEINRVVVIALIIASIFGLSLMLFFSRRLFRELIILNNFVSNVSKGDYSRKITVDKKSDLYLLSTNINEMIGKLKIADENKRRFISNMTHDLRSPLTNIIGYSSGMLDGTIAQESFGKYIKVIQEEGMRLKKLVNDMLDLSKLESGNIELDRTPLNINQMILSIAENYENIINNKGISINFNLCEDQKDAYVDKEYIMRAFDNLISNAVKFAGENGFINISTATEGQKYIVEFNNSYKKIGDEELERIFDRFVKLDDSRGKEKVSSGLGLSIVKEIIKAHGEKIYVTSDVSSGITFRLTLSIANGLLTESS